jgi:hypothetical protein
MMAAEETMNANAPTPWLDPDFLENQRKFPAEELLRYAGQHIAWSWNGSQILASDPDGRALDESCAPLGSIRLRLSMISSRIPI